MRAWKNVLKSIYYLDPPILVYSGKPDMSVSADSRRKIYIRLP